MKDIIPLEYAGQRVMTRNQLEILLECSNDQIRNVIRNHRVQFVKGEHYFELNGAEVSQYKKIGNNRLAIGRYASFLQLWTKEGVALLLQLFNTVKSRSLYAELEREYFTDTPAAGAVVKIELDAKQIMTIKGVHGYIDINQVAWLNAEDVARGLGFTQIKNGVEYIRWETVNTYLTSFGFSQNVGKDDYIPENMFYRLAMKASNETAQKFQAKIADDILPALRRQGYYEMKSNPLPPVPRVKPRPRSELAFAYVFLMDNTWVKIGHSGEIKTRIKRVEYESNLRVIDEHHTPQLKRATAMRIERSLHKKFAAQHVEGEFYNIPFEEAKAELDKITFLLEEEIIDVVTEPEIAANELERTKLLVEMLHAPVNEQLKEKLFKETANLLLGEKIF